MRKLTLALLLAALILAFAVVPAFAIVDPVTPVGCEGSSNPAKGASSGNARGAPAGPVVSGNDSPGPPFPAQGQNSPDCD